MTVSHVSNQLLNSFLSILQVQLSKFLTENHGCSHRRSNVVIKLKKRRRNFIFRVAYSLLRIDAELKTFRFQSYCRKSLVYPEDVLHQGFLSFMCYRLPGLFSALTKTLHYITCSKIFHLLETILSCLKTVLGPFSCRG